MLLGKMLRTRVWGCRLGEVMDRCVWIEECPYNEGCDYCDYNECDEVSYISREEFYKDWFEYIERINED